MAYCIRRKGNDCAVIALDPDDREEIIASGLAIGDAENLCANKIQAMRNAGAAPALFDPDPGSEPSTKGRRLARQLGFKFE